MRIAALTFLLVAGTTTTMSAAPAREETTRRISYDERNRQPAVKPHRDPGWIELASATPVSHGREFIEIAADTAMLTQLRLTASSGRPGIRAVRVDYKDGSHRTFEIEKMLGAGRRPAYVDLRGARDVVEIVVVTDRSSLGEYILEGNIAEVSVAAH